MKIWTVHPKYLNSTELIHAWRTGLYAQKSFSNDDIFDLNISEHSSLDVFYSINTKIQSDAVTYYLMSIYNESVNRNYNFDRSLLSEVLDPDLKISIYKSRVIDDYYELTEKYAKTNDEFSMLLHSVEKLELHPLFTVNNCNFINLPKHKKFIL